jgi:integrase
MYIIERKNIYNNNFLGRKLMNNTYTYKKIKSESSDIIMICYKDIPMYLPNLFISNKGKNSLKTMHDYASILVFFFNFIDKKLNINYKYINTYNAIEEFINFCRFTKKKKGDNGDLNYFDTYEPQITAGTANRYISVISNFYWELEKFNISSQKIALELDSEIEKKIFQKNKNLKYKSKYSNVWKVNSIADINIYRPEVLWKTKRKNKITLSKDEQVIILNNLKFKRDKCIFLLSLMMGARITEILSTELKDFSNTSEDPSLEIRISKTRPRTLILTKGLATMLEDYINTERRLITMDSKRLLKNGNTKKLNYIFVTSKKSKRKNKGEQLSYNAFLRNLKMAAKKGGIDESTIVTHLGRATKVTNMVANGATDEDILIIIGNKSSSSLKHYKDLTNTDVPKRTIKYINEFQEELS